MACEGKQLEFTSPDSVLSKPLDVRRPAGAGFAFVIKAIPNVLEEGTLGGEPLGRGGSEGLVVSGELPLFVLGKPLADCPEEAVPVTVDGVGNEAKAADIKSSGGRRGRKRFGLFEALLLGFWFGSRGIDDVVLGLHGRGAVCMSNSLYVDASAVDYCTQRRATSCGTKSYKVTLKLKIEFLSGGQLLRFLQNHFDHFVETRKYKYFHLHLGGALLILGISTLAASKPQRRHHRRTAWDSTLQYRALRLSTLGP